MQLTRSKSTMTTVLNREQRDLVSKRMGEMLLQGFCMLQSTCPQCDTILMRDRSQKEICIWCDELNPQPSAPIQPPVVAPTTTVQPSKAETTTTATAIPATTQPQQSVYASTSTDSSDDDGDASSMPARLDKFQVLAAQTMQSTGVVAVAGRRGQATSTTSGALKQARVVLLKKLAEATDLLSVTPVEECESICGIVTSLSQAIAALKTAQ
eukprot:m.9582 g.9582  ORF g.9582 m.9582 type:complete len:211 (+) comp5469_c0_seq1:162-794(+)